MPRRSGASHDRAPYSRLPGGRRSARASGQSRIGAATCADLVRRRYRHGRARDHPARAGAARRQSHRRAVLGRARAHRRSSKPATLHFEGSGVFVRPVDELSLQRKVEALIGPPSGRGATLSAYAMPHANRAPVLVGSHAQAVSLLELAKHGKRRPKPARVNRAPACPPAMSCRALRAPAAEPGGPERFRPRTICVRESPAVLERYAFGNRLVDRAAGAALSCRRPG